MNAQPSSLLRTVFRKKTAAFALLLPLLFGLGCDRSSAPPSPLPAAEMPAAFGKAFSKAKPELKSVADQIVAAVQAQDYSTAFNALNSIMGKGNMTKEQVDVTSRALLTVNNLLQEAQAKGDAKAAETRKTYNATK
jgi:hypothetical protein